MNTTSEHWARVKEFFSRALEVASEERKSWLAREAGGDVALIADVQSLLDSHAVPDAFLEPVSAEQRVAALGANGAQTGERIGAYRLVEMIGTGGMGDVYKAVRDDDQYKAEVAIKLMRGDVRSPLAEQRFVNERQILAQLNHRNIARLLDGGTTPNGLPYVVMELVTGESIDQFADARSLPTHERVRLFLQVCTAVSFAHQHLVVHRDLKPNNILVTVDGSVKLLDFGIAKLLEQDPVTGAPTDRTLTQLRAMTLEYASPEQVSGGTVTTASDVYSLGVVLYRMLTGSSPYRSSGDAARVVEILGDTTPTRPSQATTRDRRSIDSDLDSILLMALRKEPPRRYGSVEQLANDLRNYLDGLPVSARRGTFNYRAGKFIRRNKVSIAAATLVAASLIGGAGFTWREARIAERERAIAQRHFDSVRKLANKLFDFHDQIASLPGATQAREDLVKTSLEYLDALYRDSGDDLTLREELGTAYRRVGAIQNFDMDSSLGDSPGALRSFERAVALLEPVVAADPKNGRAAASLAQTYVLQTRTILRSQGNNAARASGEKAIALLESRRADFPDEFEHMSQLVNAYFTQAEIVGNLGDAAVGVGHLDKVVTIAEDYQRRHPNERRAKIALEKALNNAGSAIDDRLPLAEAARRSIALLRRSIAIDEELLAAEPGDLALEISIAETRYNIANNLLAIDEYGPALDELELGELALVKTAADQKDARAGYALAAHRVWTGFALARTGRPRESLPLFERAEAIITRLRNQDSEALHLRFLQAKLGIARGDAFAALAAEPAASAAQRAELWRKSRDSSARGTDECRRINDIYPLVNENKKLWDIGVANLAKAEAAIVPDSR